MKSLEELKNEIYKNGKHYLTKEESHFIAKLSYNNAIGAQIEVLKKLKPDYNLLNSYNYIESVIDRKISELEKQILTN